MMISTGRITCWRHGLARRFFYDWRTRSDTIFATATTIEPKKGSPLAIIRVSGAKTTQIIEQLTCWAINTSEDGRGKTLKPRFATLSKFFDPTSNSLIDIGLLLWFPSPNSYTGEDSCEFHVHGSQAIVSRLVDVLGKIPGLRPAEPGEFTRRAVENKKLTLLEAESLPDLIASQTDKQRKLALKGLIGSARLKYEGWIEGLVNILAHLEASIDFGEDELIGEQRVVNDCILNLRKLSQEVNHFIEVSSRCRDLVQHGARAVILGRPNAGKSTLMNKICCADKSIVSEMKGTTRDIVEHSIELRGHVLTLSDTAGLRELSKLQESSNQPDKSNIIEQHKSIEREGIRRAINEARKSDVIIYLIDGVRLMTPDGYDTTCSEVQETFTSLNEGNDAKFKSIHLVVNKIDIFQSDTKKLEKLHEMRQELESSIRALPEFGDKWVQSTLMSCKTNENFCHVIDKISLGLDQLIASSKHSVCHQNHQTHTLSDDDFDYVNERHLALLISASRHLHQAQTLDMRTIDEMAQHVRESVDYLSRIIGKVTNEQVIDVIFRDFCIGK